MSFFTRPNFEDRQQVQYNGSSITLSGFTNINNTGYLKVKSQTLDFTGTTTASTLYNIAGVNGYINNGELSSLIVEPPVTIFSGSTGSTTVDVTGYVLTSLDSEGRVVWQTPTGSNSGNCISDFYVSNIHGCSPITIHSSIQSYGSISTGNTYNFGFGGDVKIFDSDYSTILGGFDNTISYSNYSGIFGGSGNTISDSIYSSIFGGLGNKILYNYPYGWGTIIGGNNNVVAGASNYFAIIGGGNNAIGDSNAALITTESSEITGSMDYSAILAGNNHEMTTDFYTGPANTVILGGNNSTYKNTGLLGLNNSSMIGGTYMTISGVSNMNTMITSNQSSILTLNSPISLNTIVGTDTSKIVDSIESTMIGCESSYMEYTYQSTMLGSYNSKITGSTQITSSMIFGGENHLIDNVGVDDSNYNTIINGSGNKISKTNNSTIISGSNNKILDTSNQSASIISQGSQIYNNSINSTLLSTYESSINSSSYSVIIGGQNNYISGSTNTIILGGNNITVDTLDDSVYVPNLVISKPFIPSYSADTVGDVGNISWTDTHLYIKTNTGWGRISLDYAW